MCDPREPVSVASALVMLDRALDVLAHADAAGLPRPQDVAGIRERAHNQDRSRLRVHLPVSEEGPPLVAVRLTVRQD